MRFEDWQDTCILVLYCILVEKLVIFPLLSIFGQMVHLPTHLQGLEVPGITRPNGLSLGILDLTNSFFKLGGLLKPNTTFFGRIDTRLLGLSAKRAQFSKMDFLRLGLA